MLEYILFKEVCPCQDVVIFAVKVESSAELPGTSGEWQVNVGSAAPQKPSKFSSPIYNTKLLMVNECGFAPSV